MKKKNIIRTAYVVSFCVAIFLLFAIYFGLCGSASNKIYDGRANDKITVINDYHCTEVTDDKAPIGITKEYAFDLPAMINQNICLAFYIVHQYADVYIDDQKIYSISISKDNKITKTVGSNWVIIPLNANDAGKKVRVKIIPVYESFRNWKIDFLLGAELDIYSIRLKKDFPQLFLGSIAIFVGIVFIFIAAYNVIKKNRGWNIIFLGIFSTMLGIWRLTDTRFTPFMFPRNGLLVYYVSMTMLMLAIIPLMMWLCPYCSRKCQKYIGVYCVFAFLNFIVQICLQLTNTFDIREMLVVTHTVIAIGFLLDVGIVIYEKIVCKNVTKMPLGNKLIYMCIAGVIADIMAYYVKGNSSGLIFSLSALILYIVIMGIATFYNYENQEVLLARQERQLLDNERQIAVQEKALTDSRIKSMMSQIRSHFIFNVLATISTYCKIDPQKADEALIHFSRYLRKNINIIENDSLVDFDTEIEQVEDYVALEKLRYPDRITFETDISTSSFKLPPLTIQPLVENAIKHGFLEHEKSGTVIVCSEYFKSYIIIKVIDDGAGFDMETQIGKESVGIKNVRYRLENMVHGEMSIDSRAGHGTIVTIKIPLESE